AYYGVLGSGGGLLVLAGSVLLGDLLDGARSPGPAARLPWLAIAAFPLTSAALLALTARSRFSPRKGNPT
ncbi:MAG: MFS transporter, partial [Actinomycetes bacterium]